MTKTIRREILIPQPREQVWRALADSAALAEWMFPNDFVPRVGHHFTFQVPPNPKANFDGLVVRCGVLECEPPLENAGGRLAFSWSAGGLEGTRVSFRLEPDGDGTRVLFEHSGFDVSQPWGNQAFRGAEFGWAKMLEQLPAVVAGWAPATMKVKKTPTAEIAIRALDAEDVRRVNAWLYHLENWGNDAHTMKISQKMSNSDLYVLRGTNDLRIFFTLDEVNKVITVVDVAKHSVLGTGV